MREVVVRIAITRAVSRAIVNCELTFLERSAIDVQRARDQHLQYEAALRQLGLAVLSLPEEPELPDAVFVEDTALVLDECAIITRPGADSRLPETELISRVLAPYRNLFHIAAPSRLDGGDLLRLGRHIYVGLSARSDTNAMEQMQDLLQPYDYELHAVVVTGCLHLKSAVTQLSEDTLLINSSWVNRQSFDGVKFIEIEASEPYAANALLVGDSIIYPSAFPKTRARLVSAGVRVVSVDADELAKAEGAVTCCSLILNA
jgi:dimethylargininase